jgi:hypothetical protein
VGICDLRTLWSPPVSLNQERHTQRRKTVFLFILNLLFLKSPPWNPLLANLITATLFLLKFSFSPGVRAVHRSQFQATAALPRQTHTTVLRRAPSQPWGVPGWAWSAFCDEPGPTPCTVVSVGGNPGVQGARPVFRECRAGPGRPFVTDPSSVTDRRSEFIYKIVADSPCGGRVQQMGVKLQFCPPCLV